MSHTYLIGPRHVLASPAGSRGAFDRFSRGSRGGSDLEAGRTRGAKNCAMACFTRRTPKLWAWAAPQLPATLRAGRAQHEKEGSLSSPSAARTDNHHTEAFKVPEKVHLHSPNHDTPCHRDKPPLQVPTDGCHQDRGIFISAAEHVSHYYF